MAFNGAGVFLRVRNWVADATAGIKIRADFHDTEDDNFAAGLSTCITKNGQTTITQNIPFNSKRITALGTPVNAYDAATKAYADTKLTIYGGNDDLTISKPYPGITLNNMGGTDTYADVTGMKSGKRRWVMRVGNGASEGPIGSTNGSDFDLLCYDDTGDNNIWAVLNFNRKTGLGTVVGDPTAPLGIATRQYVLSKSISTGGTVDGNLTVNDKLIANGEFVAVTKVVRFGASGSPAYIQWNTGNSYSLGNGGVGNGGVIWHSGNFTPSLLLDQIAALETKVAALEARLAGAAPP